MSDNSRLNGKISLETVLLKFKDSNKEFKKNLENEESLERVESINAVENDIKGIKEDINRNKNKFINEIKTDLGRQVRDNPNGIKIIKKTWKHKFNDIIKKIFTRF